MNKHTNISELQSKNLNGYRPFHRNDFILVNLELLSIQAFCLFQFYLSIFDFDKRHKRYGIFEVDFNSIAGLFGVSSSTIWNWHKKIEGCGLVEKLTLNTFCITNPGRYTPTGKMRGEAHNFSKNEKSQSIENILKSIGIKTQVIKQTLQSIEKKDHNLVNKSSSIYNYSFKVGNGFFSDNTISNNGVYESDNSELGLSADDIKLIEESINESTPIMPKNGS